MSLDKIFNTIAERYDAEAMPGFETRVLFDLGEKPYFLAIQEGKCQTGTERIADPDATITMAADDFEAMIKGELNPMMAFTMGKIRVDGNMGVVMKLQSLLTG